MNRRLVTTAALCLAVGALVVGDADAGNRRDTKKLSKDRTEMPALYTQPHRFDRDPAMSFHRGILRRDGLAGWRIGDLQLQMRPDALVLDADGEMSYLREGSEAVVMGPRVGKTMVGWNARLLAPESSVSFSTANVGKKPSDTTPEVGELVGGPR
jgi:hypothetical protein